MRRFALLTALIAAGGALHADEERPGDAEPRHRVLVELFTSQG